MRFLLIYICLLYIGLASLYAQADSLLLEQSYDGMAFPEFSEIMASEYGLNLFSNSATDSIIVKQEHVRSYLNDVLVASFEGTEFSYYAYSAETIFLLKGYVIYDKVPRYFTLDNTAPVAEKKEDNIEFLNHKQQLKKVKKSQYISFGTPTQNTGGRKATISGQVLDSQTKEPVIGAVVMVDGLSIGSAADLDGHFELELPMGRYNIIVNSLGKEQQKLNVSLYADGEIEVELHEETTQLAGVNIIGDRVHNVQGIQVGLETMEMKTVKQLPSAMGEVDIVKTAIMLPGVQTVGEGASGFNVRGGSVDQNLILLDGAPIFNSSHLFGFFSVFNQDVIDEFMLYKSGIPSEYGGRVSSVLSVTTRSGKKKDYTALLGISPITGRAYFEGPIIKGKTSLLIAGRTTYSDWLLRRIDDESLSNSAAKFWDGNLKLNHNINDNNNLKLSLYRSSDFFKLASDTAFNYSNTCASLLWQHNYSSDFKSRTNVVFSNYKYEIEGTSDPEQAFMMDYSIGYAGVKHEFVYNSAVNNKANFGIELAGYSLNPSQKHPKGEASIIEETDLEKDQATDISLFAGDEWRITEKLLLYGGLRATAFATIGPRTSYGYADGLPMTSETRIDTTLTPSGSIVHNTIALLPRVSMRYKLGRNNSVKMSYNRLTQNLHMLSNSAAVSPTDSWILSSSNIKPQLSDVLSAGYYHNVFNDLVELSFEVYYKEVNNVIDYKGGASLLQNKAVETEILQGVQNAYGAEMLVKKKFGSLTGWLGYTYSVSRMKMESEHIENQINGGDWYPSNHDKPHDITLVGNYKFNRRLSFSNNITYSTGRPITFPVARYSFKDQELLHYSNRNEYRVPDYFRWDISVNVEGNLKSKKIGHSYWSFSVYNVTGRDNVYSIFFKTDEQGRLRGYQMSIFPQPLLTVSYNIKF